MPLNPDPRVRFWGVFTLKLRWAGSSPGPSGRFFFPIFQDTEKSHPFPRPLMETPAPGAHEREQIPPQQAPRQQRLLLGSARTSFVPHEGGPGSMRCPPGLSRGEGAGLGDSGGVTPSPALAKGPGGSFGSIHPLLQATSWPANPPRRTALFF